MPMDNCPLRLAAVTPILELWRKQRPPPSIHHNHPDRDCAEVDVCCSCGRRFHGSLFRQPGIRTPDLRNPIPVLYQLS